MRKAARLRTAVTVSAPVQVVEILGGKKTLGTKIYEDYRRGKSYRAIKSGLPIRRSKNSPSG